MGVRVPPSALHILAGQNPQRLEHDRVLESSDSHANSHARKKLNFSLQNHDCIGMNIAHLRVLHISHARGKDLDILFQERVEPKDCACPDFKIDNDIIKQWLHTEKINPGLLDFDKLRKIPKSRLPNSISHIKLKIIQHQLYVSGLKFESIGSHNVAIGVSPVYLHFSSLFMNKYDSTTVFIDFHRF